MLNYTDITEELCIRCGACCRILVPVKGNSRYIEFIQKTGLDVTTLSHNEARIDLGYCRNLEIVAESKTTLYLCKIYKDRPKMCCDYNCVAWAKVTNSYEQSDFIKRAEQINESLKNGSVEYESKDIIL